ncbi:MAG: hypothetical protein NTY85_03465 [Actinobacteria bacterium]|jgi:hypothetical protein|nr:hypothetical protein [Actinomycetota bacterium]
MNKIILKKAGKFGWLGAIITLLFTLFWPVSDIVQIILNTAIGYAVAFLIRIIKGLFEKKA